MLYFQLTFLTRQQIMDHLHFIKTINNGNAFKNLISGGKSHKLIANTKASVCEMRPFGCLRGRFFHFCFCWFQERGEPFTSNRGRAHIRRESLYLFIFYVFPSRFCFKVTHSHLVWFGSALGCLRVRYASKAGEETRLLGASVTMMRFE